MPVQPQPPRDAPWRVSTMVLKSVKTDYNSCPEVGWVEERDPT